MRKISPRGEEAVPNIRKTGEGGHKKIPRGKSSSVKDGENGIHSPKKEREGPLLGRGAF